MSQKNYYLILEVKSSATFDEIKKSYRLLVKKYHPDINTENRAAEEYFKEIQHAYEILSNPEKRRKYDLQFLYKTSHSQQQRYGGTPYTGNAYQYAQQEAQAKRSSYYKKQQVNKKDNTESIQIIISIAIAIILVYFIISFSSQKNTKFSSTSRIKKTTEVKKDEAPISNFESPYINFFGPEIFDSNSKNNITIFNSEFSEAVVCLVEKNTPHRTIRNQYMNKGIEFKMNEIPDGAYFLKVYFGKDWNPDKTFLNLAVKGGFTKENIFLEMNTGKSTLIMLHEKIGASDSFSSYDIKISPYETKNVGVISADDFFIK